MARGDGVPCKGNTVAGTAADERRRHSFCGVEVDHRISHLAVGSR